MRYAKVLWGVASNFSTAQWLWTGGGGFFVFVAGMLGHLPLAFVMFLAAGVAALVAIALYHLDLRSSLKKPVEPATPLDKLLDPELFVRVRSFTGKLRVLEANGRTRGPDPAMLHLRGSDRETAFYEHMSASNRHRAETHEIFILKYQGPGRLFLRELRRRLHLPEVIPHPQPGSCIALDVGMLAGVNPIGEVADLLDHLSEQLHR